MDAWSGGRAERGGCVGGMGGGWDDAESLSGECKCVSSREGSVV